MVVVFHGMLARTLGGWSLTTEGNRVHPERGITVITMRASVAESVSDSGLDTKVPARISTSSRSVSVE